MRHGVHVFALHAFDDFRELRGFGGCERRFLAGRTRAARHFRRRRGDRVRGHVGAEGDQKTERRRLTSQ